LFIYDWTKFIEKGLIKEYKLFCNTPRLMINPFTLFGEKSDSSFVSDKFLFANYILGYWEEVR
jgi:hypothetical protein